MVIALMMTLVHSSNYERDATTQDDRYDDKLLSGIFCRATLMQRVCMGAGTSCGPILGGQAIF